MANVTDLEPYITWPEAECLNEQSSHPLANALKQGYRDDEKLYLESDTDEQLLIHIPFNQTVKLHSLQVKSSDGGDAAPSRLKLFKNTPTLGFTEAADFPADQELALTEKQLEGELIALRFVKFQTVSSITIFVEENKGAETTKITKLVLLGSPGETFNVADIKKDKNED